jgi:hypothetical protein
MPKVIKFDGKRNTNRTSPWLSLEVKKLSIKIWPYFVNLFITIGYTSVLLTNQIEAYLAAGIKLYTSRFFIKIMYNSQYAILNFV